MHGVGRVALGRICRRKNPKKSEKVDREPPFSWEGTSPRRTKSPASEISEYFSVLLCFWLTNVKGAIQITTRQGKIRSIPVKKAKWLRLPRLKRRSGSTVPILDGEHRTVAIRAWHEWHFVALDTNFFPFFKRLQIFLPLWAFKKSTFSGKQKKLSFRMEFYFIQINISLNSIKQAYQYWKWSFDTNIAE